MTIEIFLIGLTICSLFTVLLTEAMKKMLSSYNSNILAATCSVITAVIVVVLYAVNAHIQVDIVFIANGITLVILSWLCAMVGYDKVMQTIEQILSKKS